MMTRRLALRVTLNSDVIILGVYAVMQIVTYFRDNILLGLSGFSALPATMFGFLGVNVVPPLLVFSIIVYFIALPIQRAQARLEAGEELSPDELEATRKRLLRFSTVVSSSTFWASRSDTSSSKSPRATPPTFSSSTSW